MSGAIPYEKPRLIDPLRCPHVTERGQFDGKVYCGLHDAYVDCQESHWGEPPMCAWDEPDNSDEARARRKAWREDE